MSHEHRQALPAGTRLHEYELLHVLGSGGFGVVYLAHDHELDQQVVIKEYLPGAFAVRLAGNTVVPTSPREEGNFQWGLDSFLNEARALAEFRQCPNIVSVLRYFKANNTGYMVMEYAGAVSLQDFLEVHGTLTEKQLLALVLPLLDALETIHAKGLIHRDIKPGNILINEDSQPVLIDFGAARQAIGERSMTLSVVLTQGYAPFEQYHKAGQQGAWTDIYALAAVMYRCVTGVTPPESTARMDAPDGSLSVVGAAEGDYAPHLLAAIDWGLQLRAADRPQTVAEWREAIESGAAAGSPQQPPKPTLVEVIRGIFQRLSSRIPFRQHWVAATLLGGLLLLGGALVVIPAVVGGSGPATAVVRAPPVVPSAPTGEWEPAGAGNGGGEPSPAQVMPAIFAPPVLDVGKLLATPNALLEKLKGNQEKYQKAQENLLWIDEQAIKQKKKLSSKEKKELVSLKETSEQVINAQQGLLADYRDSLKTLCPQRTQLVAQADTTGNNPVLLRHLNAYCSSGTMSYENFLRDLNQW